MQCIDFRIKSFILTNILIQTIQIAIELQRVITILLYIDIRILTILNYFAI